MKKIIKRLMPIKLYQWLKRKWYLRDLKIENRYQSEKLLHYSSTFNEDKNSQLATLTIVSHVLEKGITMPARRMGFGYERVRDIIQRCKRIISLFGADSIELQAALTDLKQYRDIHRDAGFMLPDDIDKGICDLLSWSTINDGNCWYTTNELYFKNNTDFKDFAEGRHSIRWYSDTPVDEKKLMAAIELAQTAPSACNRQATRVKIITSPECKKLCYELQNGNRGFGDKADKWLLITSELGDWSHKYPYAPYIDGGIFAMNLLYSLHYYGIVACPLNAHLTTSQRDELQHKLGYSPSEVPVLFIAIGNPTEQFMVPKSRRLDINDIIQII